MLWLVCRHHPVGMAAWRASKHLRGVAAWKKVASMIAATDTETVLCAVCGARNEPTRQRCTACGARLGDLDEQGSVVGSDQGSKPPENIAWRWVGLAALGYAAAQALLLVVLPRVLPAYDPQGMAGLLLVVAVWAAGGVWFGAVAPAKTYFEPAIAAMLTALPSLAYLMHVSDVYELPPLAYLVAALLGAMVTVLGAVLGDRLRAPSRPRTRSVPGTASSPKTSSKKS